MTELTGSTPVPGASITANFVAYNSSMYVLDYSLQANATTQYINYDFNSMVRFGDKYLGACSDGIYELDGDTDNGNDIGAYFELATTDLGITNPKKVRFMFLGYESDGDLLLTLSTDEGIEQSHTVDSAKTGQQERRISVNRNMQGRYVTFMLSNTGGCDFGFDSADVNIVVMPHRFKR